ncbi:hypothetical protein KYN89_02420 [Alteriqipengyuania sp. NZ-12B]|uniref:Ribbon-helix-helix protein, CopG family n=1 Tax=Alteriqipengyuania abyssalis TaxID=2860200 RepID=A0ABS7PA01_9SPHN|nr:hypothetical protein [Alteriqipengyuania abyssalis]MBY8335895.1 hypothetical protein [Alteriqipengyuania abyssalis]
MRGIHSDNLVAFRASDTLVSALRLQAEQSGVSVSEYLRSTVREKVGL